MEKELINKLINHITHLINVANTDEKIYGNSYFEFTDRTIRVIEPKNIELSKNKIGLYDHIGLIEPENE